MANPPSTLSIPMASGTIGAPVACIPTVFPDVVVAALTDVVEVVGAVAALTRMD